ncbi:MAG: SH3 domain-containing protein [Chloroflexi bacterium]|nr:SH3 domain-containing protein [Chloroflexota bacterium]
MRRFAIMLGIIVLCLSPSSLADDSALPLCADEEFLKFFNMIVEHQIEFDADITKASMLRRVSRAQMERREAYTSELPMCADAIAIQRLLIQLSGDALGRAALESAGLPAGDNPYFLRLPDSQARIEDLLSTMLGVDRSAAPPPLQRELPACGMADLSLLVVAAAEFLDLDPSSGEGANPAESLDSINRLLQWREENIPLLPLCAESIDLAQALSAASTDSAAAKAFNYAGLSAERNPFPPLLKAGVATVTNWLDQWSAAVVSQASAAPSSSIGGGRLPPCAPSDLPAGIEALKFEYAALLERDAAKADLANYGAAQIAFRQARLAQLPNCEETFALRWFSMEALADVSLRLAVDAGSSASPIENLPDAAGDSEVRVANLWTNLEDLLAHGQRKLRQGQTAASTCSDADELFLLSYLLPVFWEFTDAALTISQPEEVAALVNQSYAFRQLLWKHLPRCDDALAMGLLMRAIAADTVAMLALELAGLPAAEIPYLPKISRDMERLFDRIGEFYSACGTVHGATMTYYVTAANIANVRACASTICNIVTTASRGQRIDVVDDLSNWYEIVLPNCETAFIAGFLASQTPPDR